MKPLVVDNTSVPPKLKVHYWPPPVANASRKFWLILDKVKVASRFDNTKASQHHTLGQAEK